MNRAFIFFMLFGFLACPTFAEDPNSIFERGKIKWADVVLDDALGAVSASGMLGIDGDAVTTVDSPKALVMALKGLSSNDSKGTIALGVTPARTSFMPMDLTTYATKGIPARLLGSLMIGYAQGDSEVEGKKYARRAVSLQTSAYLDEKQDPIIAVANESEACMKFDRAKPQTPPNNPGPPPAARDSNQPNESSPDELAVLKKRAAECAEKALNALRWNRSLISLSISKGWVKPSDDGTPQSNLGTSWSLGLLWGFNPGFLTQGAAITLGHRVTKDEPVLATLASGNPTRKDSQVTMLRLSGGSDNARLHLEFSNARDKEITETQRAFKRAVGADVRLAEGLWLNFRVGRLATIKGGQEETGSLLSLSYSPKALLQGVGSPD